jgi:hypothetical protein
MINQEGEFKMNKINLEADKESGLNLSKCKFDCCGYHFGLLLSNNALTSTDYGLDFLKHNNIWTEDTGVTMHSTFCGAQGINTCATTLSTTVVSGGSIKPSL